MTSPHDDTSSPGVAEREAENHLAASKQFLEEATVFVGRSRPDARAQLRGAISEYEERMAGDLRARFQRTYEHAYSEGRVEGFEANADLAKARRQDAVKSVLIDAAVFVAIVIVSVVIGGPLVWAALSLAASLIQVLTAGGCVLAVLTGYLLAHRGRERSATGLLIIGSRIRIERMDADARLAELLGQDRVRWDAQA